MSARARRAIAGRRLYDEMSAMIFATTETGRTLFAALCEARAIHGGKAKVVEDVKRPPLSLDRLILGAELLGGRLACRTPPGEAAGLLRPNVPGAPPASFAQIGSASCRERG